MPAAAAHRGARTPPRQERAAAGPRIAVGPRPHPTAPHLRSALPDTSDKGFAAPDGRAFSLRAERRLMSCGLHKPRARVIFFIFSGHADLWLLMIALAITWDPRPLVDAQGAPTVFPSRAEVK